MLIGSYLSVLGDKRRTAIPKKFLDELGNDLVLAKWYEDCLVLVRKDFWNGLLDRLTGGSKVASLGVRDIERFILGSAFDIQADEQGRIVVPEVLAKFAGLGNELIFIGLGDRVEVWNKETWEIKEKEVAKTSKDYIENLANERR
jgi:MraZ protein